MTINTPTPGPAPLQKDTATRWSLQALDYAVGEAGVFLGDVERYAEALVGCRLAGDLDAAAVLDNLRRVAGGFDAARDRLAAAMGEPPPPSPLDVHNRAMRAFIGKLGIIAEQLAAREPVGVDWARLRDQARDLIGRPNGGRP